MDEELKREIWGFMDQHRARALWWMRADYYPQTSEEARTVLEAVERRCSRSEWIHARRLARRLS